MSSSKRFYGKHFISALVWVSFAGMFAYAPLFFLQWINAMSEENISMMEINHLLKAKMIIFVACAITATVVFDFIVSEPKISGWLPFFAIYLAPFCMFVYLFLKYLLVYVQLGDQHDFGPGSLTTQLTVLFAIVYSVLAKTLYYIKKDYAGRSLHL